MTLACPEPRGRNLKCVRPRPQVASASPPLRLVPAPLPHAELTGSHAANTPVTPTEISPVDAAGQALDLHRAEVAEELVNSKSHRLCRRRGFSRSDRDEIAQQLRIHLWIAAGRYDPTRGPWEKFVSFILDKRCASIRRARFAEMRSPEREQCSLDDANGCGTLRDQLARRDSGEPQRLLELEKDVAWATARMSKLEQEIALKLAHGTVNSAAKELGLPRSRIERHVDAFGEMFRAADLDGYL